MRRLILTRGPQGSGKSTTLHQMGLAPYALSMDALRTMFAGPELQADGTFAVSQAYNQDVSRSFLRRIRERMERGELLALDTTGGNRADLEGYLELAREHRYQVAVLDYAGVPLAQCLAHNAQREPMWRVPELAVRRTHQSLQTPLTLPAEVAHIRWSADGSHVHALESFLDVPVEDLSGYANVVVIGDLQGCLRPLIGPGGPLEHGLRDDTCYIFVGDLVDRGPENAEVIRWFLDHAVDRSNVRLLWGNHEDHLHRFARRMKPVSPEFAERTLPQLLRAGIAPEEVERICAKAVEVLPFTYQGHRVLATHAGLSTVPSRLAAISTDQYTHGTGNYSDPIDGQFDRLAPAGWEQVHGHRNHQSQAVLASARSINLEDSVEHGGHLRWAVLNAQGWSGHSVRNTHFVPFRERRRTLFEHPAVPDWMARPSATRFDPELLAAMQAHEGIREKTNASTPDIVSLNFTKQVFFDKSWDDLVIKARGLFVHTPTGEVVARGYEKFFNIGERSDTQMGTLRQSLQWPITAYVKENGFLGLVGINPANQDLFLTSKSTPDSDFAAWFREIFEASTTAEQREDIRRYLVNHDAGMAFEVIDPVRDPHMIEYAAPKLVLLDVFHRSANLEKLSYEQLQTAGQSLGLTVKARGMQFNNWESFEGWYKVATRDLNYRFKGQDIEGFVIEDAAGFQTKVKLPHYAFWKTMRGAKDRLVRRRKMLEEAQTRRDGGGNSARQMSQQIEGILARDAHPLAQSFLTWAKEQPLAALDADIITLRQQFLAQHAAPAVATALQTPWTLFDPNVDGDKPEAQAPAKAQRPKM